MNNLKNKGADIPYLFHHKPKYPVVIAPKLRLVLWLLSQSKNGHTTLTPTTPRNINTTTGHSVEILTTTSITPNTNPTSEAMNDLTTESWTTTTEPATEPTTDPKNNITGELPVEPAENMNQYRK